MGEVNSKSVEKWWNKFQNLVDGFTYKTHIEGWSYEDVRQECYVLLYSALEKFNPDFGVPFEIYYRKLLWGWRLNCMRKQKERPIGCGGEKDFLKKDETVDVEAEAVTCALSEEVERALMQLNESERELVVAFYYEKLPLKTIAKLLGVSYKGAEIKKAMIIKKLSKIIR